MRKRKLFAPRQMNEMDEFILGKTNVSLNRLGNIIEVSWGDENEKVEEPKKSEPKKKKTISAIDEWDDTLPLVKETLKERKIF